MDAVDVLTMRRSAARLRAEAAFDRHAHELLDHAARIDRAADREQRRQFLEAQLQLLEWMAPVGLA